MAEVWKYELVLETTIQMPIGAKILSANEQFGDICIWALVNPTVEHEARMFEVYGTGHPIVGHEDLKFIDTVMINNGKFVFHVFERVNHGSS